MSVEDQTSLSASWASIAHGPASTFTRVQHFIFIGSIAAGAVIVFLEALNSVFPNLSYYGE